jgi:hypothetical protein
MTDSFYLQRLKQHYENNQRSYIRQGETVYSTYVHRRHLGYTAEVRYTEISYTEETYKGHQLIIRKLQIDWAYVLENGNRGRFTDDEIKALPDRSEWQTDTLYSAYVWKIRDLDDEPAVLDHLWGSDRFIIDNFGTNSHQQTTNKAKKRIDIEATLLDHKSVLNELAENTAWGKQVTQPYNLKVNDWVWIQAHGRLRNGVIIGTQGRRFIVGYTTPNNPHTMKYKTLNLSEISVVEGDLIETQAHNFVQIGA